MIDLYAWTTSNARKVSILLEELGLSYKIIPVNLQKGEQKSAAFLSINPNGKIPAIVDHDTPDGVPLAIFDSSAILIYLAEKTGRLLPTDPRHRHSVLEWLIWQSSDLTSAISIVRRFRTAGVPLPQPIESLEGEPDRLLGVLDRQLAGAEYVAGAYSIADIAIYSSIQLVGGIGLTLSNFPNVARWSNVVAARPSVAKGVEVLSQPLDKVEEDRLPAPSLQMT